MESQPFPFVVDPTKPPLDGLFQAKPKFCTHKAKRSICENHYRSILSSPGPHRCPYGYGSYVAPGEPAFALTALNLAGYIDRDRLKRRHHQASFRKTTVAEIEEVLRHSATVIGYFMLATEVQEYIAGERAADQQMMAGTLHDVRKLNQQLKHQIEQCQRRIRAAELDRDFIKYRLENCFATTSLISVRLDSYDFAVNPGATSVSRRRPVPVFRRFEKAKHVLHARARQGKAKINIEGKSTRTIQGYDVFDVLPFLILENAVKFSPPNSEIAVRFNEEPATLTITVESVGPLLEKGEESEIFKQGFRGVNARSAQSGTGLGLWLAKRVCAIHGIAITARSDGSAARQEGDVKYAPFVLTLRLESPAN
jgi:light-regulated signal transduction histidine kinase (bacteriophytochrome)